MNKPRTAAVTPSGLNKLKNENNSNQDYDRGIKRVIGVIRELDVFQDNKMYVYVDVPTKTGRFRPFGSDKTRIAIIDNPTDILLRWGGVRIGQKVELFYRGISETGEASATIIGDDLSPFTFTSQIPEEGFSVAATLPFEPGGF